MRLVSERISGLLQGRGNLHRQALLRLLMVGILAVLAITMMATNAYYTQLRSEVEQKRISTRQFYEKELSKQEERWLGDAQQMKARIEFSRILEEPGEARWLKLNAYLNAQSDFTHFSNLLIMRDENDVLFRYGHDAHKIQVNPALLTSNWYYATEALELYRVYRMPVWLGKEGQGILLLLKSVNTAALAAMAAPETHIHLFLNDRLLVTSDGDIPGNIRPGIKEIATSAGLLVHAELPWPGSGTQPVMILQREIHSAFPMVQFLLRPFVVILIIVAMIWLGLGRWLARTVRRVENLESATNDYAQFGAVSRVSKQLRAASGQPDEISDLAQSMEKLMLEVDSRNLEQRAYLDTLSMLEEAVLEISSDGTILRASSGWSKLSHSENVIGRNIYDFIHQNDREALQSHFLALSSGDKIHAITRLRLDGVSDVNAVWVECRFVSVVDEAGKFVSVRGVLRDITQTYLHEKQITHMALHDALTGLPNRVLLEDRINVSMRQATRMHTKVGICFIDLDHFKNVNDSLGHSSGDKLLLAFAERLRRHFREVDTVARWGGDEFVVLLPDMDSIEDIRDIAKKLGEEVQAPLRIEDAEMLVTFSMGIALYPDDGESTEVLFSQADRAMFFAKAQGRNQACFFRDMSANAIGKRELYIQNRLASAIKAEHIQAWFQPVIAADSGLCAGVEVLARWHDDEHGWISPVTFIPMAENLGLIQELGHQVLIDSLAVFQRWQEAGRNLDLTLAINVSRRQLFKPYYTERLKEEVARYNIAPHRIVLEVTESVAMLDVEHAADRLQEIRNAGFKIALDDFGTGYSSLSQLHEMHVDELKIDISFVRRLHEANGLSMTQAIINLAHSLNMETVAEGVETEETAIKLRQLGVRHLQGFYFARPMPVEEFEAWLLDYKPTVSLTRAL